MARRERPNPPEPDKPPRPEPEPNPAAVPAGIVSSDADATVQSFQSWCAHTRETIRFPRADGSVLFVPVLGEAT